MPLYEYECPLCKCRFEIRQSYDDKSLIRCPKCKGEARRLLSSVATVNWSFGWRLTEASHERFSEDEWEKDI